MLWTKYSYTCKHPRVRACRTLHCTGTCIYISLCSRRRLLRRGVSPRLEAARRLLFFAARGVVCGTIASADAASGLPAVDLLRRPRAGEGSGISTRSGSAFVVATARRLDRGVVVLAGADAAVAARARPVCFAADAPDTCDFFFCDRQQSHNMVHVCPYFGSVHDGSYGYMCTPTF
eukprot:m.925202 g.925202  ORF g.925202 m.925202 type:complete len:176 (-) comp23773_c0_seq7:2083-2610(-)